MTTQAVSGRRYFTKAWLLEQKSLIALLVLIAIVSTLSPNFFTVNNLFNILQQTSVNAIMAVGMTLVILTSGIDLSVGSLLALTGAVAASIVGVEVNALVAVAAALALGAAIGAVTGIIIAPPTPCTTRKITNSDSELESAQASEPNVNRLTATIKTRRVPKRSASRLPELT